MFLKNVTKGGIEFSHESVMYNEETKLAIHT